MLLVSQGRSPADVDRRWPGFFVRTDGGCDVGSGRQPGVVAKLDGARLKTHERSRVSDTVFRVRDAGGRAWVGLS